jgi:hypothetical protein
MRATSRAGVPKTRAAHQRRVVAVEGGADFDQHGIADAEAAAHEAGMRQARPVAGGHDGIARHPFGTGAHHRIVAGGGDIVLGGAFGAGGDGGGGAEIGQPRGFPHVGDLARRLDDARALGDAGTVHGARQPARQLAPVRDTQEAGGFLDADDLVVQAARAQRIERDGNGIVGVVPGGDIGRVGVAGGEDAFEEAQHEERLAVQRDHDQLKIVIAEGLVARQVKDRLRRGADQNLHAARLHRRAHGREARFVLLRREEQFTRDRHAPPPSPGRRR